MTTFGPVPSHAGLSCWRLLARLLAMGAMLAATHAAAQQAGISERLPIRSRSNISPPLVVPPVHQCAALVAVSGFVPNLAIVRVYANGTELIGEDKPKHAPANIKLMRALTPQDSLTATQTIGTVSSDPSWDAVPVTDYPALTKPVVIPDIYECGRVVPVGNLVASTHVEVSDITTSPVSLVGAGDTTGDWDAVVTSPLVVQHAITAQQIACPAIAGKTVSSAPSESLKTKAAPNPPPTVSMDVPVIGTEQVVVHKLLVGAQIQINYGNTPFVDGLANAADNIADVPPVPPSTPITAVQTLCSASVPSPVVTATSKPVTPVLGGPVCAASHYVTVDKTTPGLNVALLRNGSVIGYGGGMLGTLKLGVGAGITLADGDSLSAVQYVSSSFGTFFSDPSNTVKVGCAGAGNVVTQHNDNNRTGVNSSETTLTPAAVLARGMHVKWQHAVEGWINTQPLFVREVAFPRGTANGVFIAAVFTNKVYALNADSGDEAWSVTLQDSDPARRGLAMGIDSAPVIDVANQRIYMVFGTKNQPIDSADLPDSTKPATDGQAHVYQDTDLKNLDTAFWVVALDLCNGKELARALVSASTYRANGQTVSFEAPFQRQHPALLLDHGALYVGFGSIAGSEGFLEYHGWVMAYRADDLALQGSFNTSRNYAPPRSPYQMNNPDDASGIWQGGGGLAADVDGNVFFLTGNGTADIANDRYGDTFVKLFPTGTSLIPAGFVPSDAAAMANNDADFGGGGTMVIPGTGLVIGGGKPGYMYLLDRKTMKLKQEFTASTNQSMPNARDDTWNMGPHLHGSPTYWRGPDERFGNLYVWGEKDVLRRYRFDVNAGLIQTNPLEGAVLALQDARAMPGGMISLSSNGNRKGTGVLWATLPADSVISPHPGRLYAFDAETLKPLWDTAFPSLGHWLPPTIADGKVFIGTSSNVMICYELGPEQHAQPGSSWHPFQPHMASMSMKRTPGTQWNEAPMTTLPENTLRALAPPADASRYAVLNAQGIATFAARNVTAGGTKLTWKTHGDSLDTTVTRTGQLYPEDRRITLTISPDLAWTASDGSRAETSLVNSYTAPEDMGAAWQLYRVTRSSGDGILAGAAYIQRVMTDGGLPPASAPRSAGATVRTAFTAQYVLFGKTRP